MYKNTKVKKNKTKKIKFPIIIHNRCKTMNKHFEKLKTEYLIRTVLLCAASGVAAGLLAVGIVLLSLKLNAININPAFYVLIGAGVAAALFSALFFILRPDDKKVAKNLDDGYSLNEKIQTMVEYSKVNGALVNIQREDAAGRLSALKLKAPPVKRIVAACCAFVLGLAVFITSVAVPAKAVQNSDVTEEPEIEWMYTEIQRIEVEQLIADVKSSGLNESVKSSVEDILTEMHASLGKITLLDGMRGTVLSAVAKTDAALSAENSYLKISKAVAAVQNELLTPLAEKAVEGVSAYRSLDGRITTLARVNEIALTFDDSIAEALLEGVQPIILKFSEYTGVKFRNFYADLTALCDGLSAAIENCGYDESDGFYKSFTDFIAGLRVDAERANSGGGMTIATILGFVPETCEKFTLSAAKELGVQTYVCMTDEFIRNRLADIFGLRIADLPSNEDIIPPAKEENNGNGDNKNPNQSGGGGDKIKDFGSDDYIYSPQKDDHVKYVEEIYGYNAEVNGRLLNGEADDELAESIRKYFEILFDGIKDDENQDEKTQN